MAKLRYGCCQFDDPKAPGYGWASVTAEPANRIRGTGDLASDTIWWTNLSYDERQVAGITKPNIKHSGYLRSDMKHVAAELGLVPRTATPTRVTEVLSEIFNRVMRLARNHYHLDAPFAGSLSGDLRLLLLPPDPYVAREIHRALGQSFQSGVRCEGGRKRDAKFVTMHFPRWRYAQALLTTPVPTHQWELVEQREMPPLTERVRWLIGLGRPALARVAVLSTDPEYADLVAYGGGAWNTQRGWMTSAEIETVAPFSTLRLDAVFLGAAYDSLETYHPLISTDGFEPLSVSVGLLAESHWVALANATHASNRQDLVSPRAAWLRAADRTKLLQAAIEIKRAGLRCFYYGSGALTLELDPDELGAAICLGGKLGLQVPVAAWEEAEIQEKLAAGLG